MDVAIIYSKDIFSENTETIIRGYLTKMNPSEMEGLEIQAKFYDLREIDHQTVAVTIRKANVKIVIISHHLLVHLDSAVRQQKFSILNRVLNKSAVIAVLVRVTDAEIRQHYIDLLPHYENWNALELRTLRVVDSHFCKIFTEQIIRSYNMQRSSSQPKLTFRGDPPFSPPVMNPSQESPLDTALRSDNTGILRIKSEILWEERVVKMTFDQQINAGDIVSIRLKKSEHCIGEIGDENIFSANFKIPEPSGRPYNSLSLEVVAPTTTSTVARQESLYKNTIALESAIQKLPAYRKCLDEHVSEILSKHFKIGTPYELDPRLDMILEVQDEKSSLFPTFMHLAVHYGLEGVVWTLLEQGNGIEMCEIQNCNSDTPLSIAEQMGFSLTIGKTIQDYKEVMVTWEALQYMKVLYENSGLRKPSTAGFHRSMHDDRLIQPTSAPRILENVSEDVPTRQDSPPTTPSQGASRFLPDVVIGTADEDAVSSDVHVQLRRESTQKGFGHIQRATRPEYIDINDLEFDNLPQFDSPITEEPISVTGHYDEPPEPKPVLPPKKLKYMELTQNTSPILMKKDGTLPRNADGYIPMVELGSQIQSPGDSADYLEKTELDQKVPNKPAHIDIPEGLGNNLGPTSSENSDPSSGLDSLSERATASPTKTVCLLDPTEMELMEVLVGVKEKVISMRQVEEFFSSWKDRPDVKLHYKEKQKDLEELRAEYARIQAEQGGNINLPLFDRVIKLFGMSRRKKASTVSESIETSPARTTEPNDDNDSDCPPPIFQRKDKQCADNSPVSDKVWGNAMCRKCVGVSYVEPTTLNDTTSLNFLDSAEGYIDIGDTNQLTPDDNVTQGSNVLIERISSGQSLKEITTEDSEDSNTSVAHTLTEVDLDTVSQTPPPIPPKKKDLKLTFDTNRPVPVRPPRNTKDRAHHFVNYNDRKASLGSSSISPDYTNSPKNEADSSPQGSASGTSKGSGSSSISDNSSRHFF